jgi:hypothetical protein
MTLADQTLVIAQSQVGVVEQPKGSNSGPEVNTYLKSVGLGAGYSWCMAFVYWCVNQAASKLAVPNPLVKTGGVMVQWNSTKLRLLPTHSSAIKPGDIFVMEFSHGLGHTGIVEKIEKGLVYTIEGNTNEDGSREGYEVARRVRSITQFKGFIQLP